MACARPAPGRRRRAEVAARAARPPKATAIDGGSPHRGPVHLRPGKGAQGARRQGRARQRDAELPAGRQDRCGRPERRRQVQPPQDHGRAGPAEQRRGPAHARLHRRHARPGAAAQRRQDRPRQRRGGGRRDQGQAGAVQRDRRADGHRLLRRADGGDGPAPGGAGPRRRVGHRLQARAGHGRAALPAAGRRRHPALRW